MAVSCTSQSPHLIKLMRGKLPLQLFFLASLMQVRPALAIDLQPGDIVAPPPDMNFLQVSYQASRRGDFYMHDQKVSDQTQFSNNQFQFRYSRTFETASLPSVFYVQTPLGYLHPEKASTASPFNYRAESGIGDTSMLYAIWPYSNRETKTYWAIGAYLTVPTGDYYAPNGAINMGANRYASALQTGYQTALTSNIDWMVAVDAMEFGDHHEFGVNKKKLEQDPLYTLQTGLSYQINPRYSVAGTYYLTAGGETYQDGIAKDDMTELQRYQLSLISNFSIGRVILQYGSDLKTKNGFYEDSRLILRFVTRF